ncbi:MAG: glycoside hydrolase family 13 protein [Clostridia bacterium]|nr:glycoside hydrolase family 13 protein [Clostridia bacterium]
MLTFLHDSRLETFRTPFGAVQAGQKVTLKIECLEDDIGDPAEVTKAELFVRFFSSKDETETDDFSPEISSIPLKASPMTLTETKYGKRYKAVYECCVSADVPGVIFYGFRFTVKEKGREIPLFYGNNEDLTGGEGSCREGTDGPCYSITCYRKGLKTPDWYKKSVIYQIFPDRFAKGYDALAQNKPNSFMYGTWDDLPMYVKDADNNILRWDFHGGNLAGISEKLPYIEDLGANAIYLNPIFRSQSNHRYDTEDYMHVDGLLGGDPAFDLLLYVCSKNNIRIILDGVFSHTGADSIYFDKNGRFGGGAYKNPSSKYRNWYRFSEETDDKYDCWWGVDVLPNVNELAPGYMDFIAKDDDSVIRHWLRKGVSGFRLDVADELPDKFIKELASACVETSEETGDQPVILGEVWEDASTKVSYGKLRSYFTERELHTVTDYPFRNILLSFFKGEESGKKSSARFLSLKENYPRENFYALTNMTGSHDVPRLMTEMLKAAGGRRTLARRFVTLYATVMFTYPGVPMIYYGDETCLEGGEDPDNRRTYPWGREDKNMISVFKKLAAMRKENKCLTLGELEFIDAGEDAICYVRSLGDEKIAVIVSRDSEPVSEIEIRLETGTYRRISGGPEDDIIESTPGSRTAVTLYNGCAVLKKD